VAPGEPKLPGKLPGSTYTWQFYLRRGLTDVEFLRYVCWAFWNLFRGAFEVRPFQLTGLETGATPLVIALAMTAPFPVQCFLTRAERKAYGLKNRFEGIVDHSLPVMMVDDMSHSKNTMVRCQDCLIAEGLQVYDQAFVIVDKDVAGHTHGLLPTIVYLFKASQFHLTYDDYFNYAGEPPPAWTRESDDALELPVGRPGRRVVAAAPGFARPPGPLSERSLVGAVVA